ncbi:MAG: NAD-dependent epimerase/dehydratase family protein [Lachnospiraceae bacterium]|nr:NAD-dependent epimerase/dehydratase family protein [Lachnospiraceae bacterium]
MKILITGFSGFVSRHFLRYLYDNSIDAEIIGIDIAAPQFDYMELEDRISVDFFQVDLLDKNELEKIFRIFSPEYILHLASYSSVAYSWKHPEKSFINNTNIFLNLVSVVKSMNIDARILSVGSSEEYGNVSESDLPLTEKQTLSPNSPYAVARVSQEQLSKVFADSFHMNIVLTRSFNHIGPYQDERFAVPSFIKRILDISRTAREGVIETGDISLVRDFVDVRDVVRAYYLLLTRGTPGQVYNICSGKGIPLQAVINIVAELQGVTIRTKVNPEYVRPMDNKVVIGSALKLERELGWKPVIPIEKTLKDMCMIMAEMNREYEQNIMRGNT